MRKLGIMLGVLLLASTVAACEGTSAITAPTAAQTDDAAAPGGGYGSGGKNVSPTQPLMDGGGTYGSGGFTQPGGGGYGSGGIVQTGGGSTLGTESNNATCEQLGGGGYGSGGRSEDCEITVPTP